MRSRENGSGKSTLKILVGALGADAGTLIHVDRLGYCPQVPAIYGTLGSARHVATRCRAGDERRGRHSRPALVVHRAPGRN